MQIETRSALQIALRAIEEAIASRPAGDTSMLPGIRALARTAGVSLVTMCNAVGVLKKDGRLVSIPGKGIFPAGKDRGDPGAISTFVRHEKWEVVRKKLLQDIWSGVLAPMQPLPPCKELSRRFGSGHHTVKKALESLARDGVVSASGRRYSVALNGVGQPYAEIVLIGAANEQGIVPPITQRDHQFINAVEAESCRRNFRLVRVGYRDSDDNSCFYTHQGRISDIAPGNFVLGYIVWPRLVRHLPRLVQRMTELRKPVALLREETFREPLFGAKNWPENIRIVDIGRNERLGAVAAQYLLSKGHTRIAYVNPFFGRAWSHERLNGFCATYAAAGFPGGVVDVSPRAGASDYSALLTGAMEPRYAGVLGEIGERLDRVVAASMRRRRNGALSETGNYLRDAIFHELLDPWFDRLLEDPTITAWVGANDQVARLILDHLYHHHVPVPDRVAVMGFDDTVDAYTEDLTSYSFNMPAAVGAMVSYILNPSLYRKMRPEDSIAVDGTFVERSSTRK